MYIANIFLDNSLPVNNISTNVNPICPASDTVDSQSELMVTAGKPARGMYYLIIDG